MKETIKVEFSGLGMLLSESMLIERIIKGGEVNTPSFKKEINVSADHQNIRRISSFYHLQHERSIHLHQLLFNYLNPMTLMRNFVRLVLHIKS